jgi:hypothetical protein
VAILSEGVDDFLRAEQSRVVAECHFDLRRIRAARHDVFLTLSDLENANGNDFEIAMRAMDRISRYENRALSKRKTGIGQAERLMSPFGSNGFECWGPTLAERTHPAILAKRTQTAIISGR